MCGICEIQHHIHAPASEPEAGVEGFSGILEVIKKVFSGNIKGFLSPELFAFTSSTLFNGVEKGFGKKLVDIDYDTPDAEMLQAMKENVFVFSGFKTYQELRTMTDALIGEDGKPLGFNEFKAKALAIHSDYDIRFLESEYDNAIKSAQSAAQWQRIQADKEAMPYLKYSTVHDSRVRPEHKTLDGIILPIDDVFWNTFYPPNGWGCRCDVIQVDRGTLTDKSKIVPPDMLPMFKNNVGKNGVVFPSKHPYFNVPKTEAPKIEAFAKEKVSKTKKAKGLTELQEIEAKILQNGVKEVNLKGLTPELAQSVLNAVEKEYALGNLELKSITTISKKRSTARAMYYTTQERIEINTPNVKSFVKQEFKTYEQDLIEKQAMLENLKLLKNDPNYKVDVINWKINSMEGAIESLKKLIKKGEVKLPWSMSSQGETAEKALEITMRHEIGHYRHIHLLKDTTNIKIDYPVSNYSKTNKREYFAEWYAHYTQFGEDKVPEDMLKLFKSTFK